MPKSDDNVSDAFLTWARRIPHAPAIIDGPSIVTFGALESAMRRAAHSFVERGWPPGSVVGVALEQASVALHLAATLALAKLGIVNLIISRDEIQSGEATRLLRRHGAIGVLSNMPLPDDIGCPAVALDASVFDSSAPVPAEFPQTNGNGAPWLLARSSGTTGQPKEYYLTHAMELLRHTTKPPEIKLAMGERFASLIDLGFITGLRASLWCLFDGGTIIVLPRAATVADVFSTIDRFGVTSVVCTPTHLPILCAGLKGEELRLPFVKTFRVSGAAVAETLLKQAQRCLTPNLLIIYGANEAWNIAVATGDLLARFPATAGYLAPGVDLQIVDRQHKPVAPGTLGEVRVRAPGMIAGYIENPEADSRHFHDGWFYPRDAGVLNEAGLLFLSGRTDEMMNFDAMLVSPQEIEKVVLQYPGITDAAAFGVQHESRGDLPHVAVVSDKVVDKQQLLGYCQSHLGRHAPVVVVQVQSLPRNAAGKILRRKLTDAMQDRARALRPPTA
jgi:acyl-coenzyme A synthetase/AMP-(fatty) acid ligase